MRRWLAPLVLLAVLALAAPAQAAAPRFILVSGHGLRAPIMLANWRENLTFMLEQVNGPKADAATRSGLAARPRLRLSLFWGWGDQPRPKWPSQANQHGWFYPAYGAAPAVAVLIRDYHPVARLASPRFLAILARHHVPVRLPPG